MMVKESRTLTRRLKRFNSKENGQGKYHDDGYNLNSGHSAPYRIRCIKYL
jgi:hypothetical protein